MGADFWLVVEWWAALFLVGAFAFPISKRLFTSWWDGGYLFAKAVGLAVVTYIVYAAGTLHVLPFTRSTIFAAFAVVFLLGIGLHKGDRGNKGKWATMLFEEAFFFLALLFWSWVKGHQPGIHDLEKFMDFGFTKSVLNSTFFPAADMWYAGGSINYYYFGHIVLATLTKLSGIDLAYTFNLMLASIFALTLTMSFSIGVGVIGAVREVRVRTKVIAGVLTAFLVTLAGNLQTIYAFTRGYTGDPVGGPPPFWQLGWSLQGLASYWYANATRFIPFTIHEFPSYSFVVSDVHGHVLSLPFVLLAIALLVGGIGEVRERRGIGKLIFYGFLVGVLLMTNALDGPIYLGLFIITLGIFNFQFSIFKWAKQNWKSIGIVFATATLTSLPFLLHFKSFVSGVAVNCPPAFLQLTKVGPLLFEGAEKCQRSPLWMLLLLWGFFLYCGMGLLGRFCGVGGLETKRTQIEKLLLVFFVFSIGLIIFPEVLYFKDIYPMHFRSNTMFKLGYQAFVLFSIVSGYTIIVMLTDANAWFRKKFSIFNFQFSINGKRIFIMFFIPLLFLVSIYPIFSVRSYFNNLASYEGLYGLTWLAKAYPDDFQAIEWLNRNVKDSVIAEAEGDSYTDYARVSAFTGLPTIIGWPVHEWLWRGSYDIVAPRREDVRLIYESKDTDQTQQLFAKYHVQYVIIGALERKKYTSLVEEKFRLLGSEVFRSGQTVIYRVGK